MSTVDLTSGYGGVGRRLSGSSSKVSLRDEDMESLDFNINDISRASSPASVSAKSEGHLHRDRRHRHSFRSTGGGDDDYRRRYSKVKSELDAEKSKTKAMNKDKIEEMRQIREYYEKERHQEHSAMQKRFEAEKKKELARLKEELVKQKDLELQQVLKYKEDEIRIYRSHTPGAGSKTPLSERSRTPAGGRHMPETPRTPRTLDRPHSPESTKDGGRTPGRQTPGRDSITEEILRSSRSGRATGDLSERARTPGNGGGAGGGRLTPMVSQEEDRLKETQSKVQLLEDEIVRLTKQRDEMQAKYKHKCQTEVKKDKEMVRLKEEYDGELRRVIGEYKKVALGNLQKLKLAEHALKEGSMSEDDVLQIPLGNPQNLHIRRMSSSSTASLDGRASTPGGTAGAESGDEGVSTAFDIAGFTLLL
ncbi:janus kinase and microtubule-interacting protein 3-like [Littorina saxatilis]|uniref:Uncharacterized protein n=1 Tax=Littorina saxatilis TaxID=31220 RepID=A0AAN9AJ96_9CAEN